MSNENIFQQFPFDSKTHAFTVFDMKNEKAPPACIVCGGSCCRYVAIEIDRPTTKTQYDHVRWYLLHENVNVFIEHDNKWYVEFRSPCEKLDDNGLCSIHKSKTRPRICKTHGEEEGSCEYYDSPYKIYFSTAKQFETYLEKKGKDWRWKTGS